MKHAHLYGLDAATNTHSLPFSHLHGLDAADDDDRPFGSLAHLDRHDSRVTLEQLARHFVLPRFSLPLRLGQTLGVVAGDVPVADDSTHASSADSSTRRQKVEMR